VGNLLNQPKYVEAILPPLMQSLYVLSTHTPKQSILFSFHSLCVFFLCSVTTETNFEMMTTDSFPC
jgi:hypothetical protein